MTTTADRTIRVEPVEPEFFQAIEFTDDLSAAELVEWVEHRGGEGCTYGSTRPSWCRVRTVLSWDDATRGDWLVISLQSGLCRVYQTEEAMRDVFTPVSS